MPAHQCGPTDQMLFWDCNFEPVSTGPFVLSQWIEGVRLVFEPNPNYFVPERPLAEQLIFEIQSDPEFRQPAHHLRLCRAGAFVGLVDAVDAGCDSGSGATDI